jgi:tetratricopeptide (TPR) repeat protein
MMLTPPDNSENNANVADGNDNCQASLQSHPQEEAPLTYTDLTTLHLYLTECFSLSELESIGSAALVGNNANDNTSITNIRIEESFTRPRTIAIFTLELLSYSMHTHKLSKLLEVACEQDPYLAAPIEILSARLQVGADYPTNFTSIETESSELAVPQPPALPTTASATSSSSSTENQQPEPPVVAPTVTVINAVWDKAKVLEYYALALSLQQTLGDKRGVAAIYHNTGEVYYALENNTKALAYYELALPLRRQMEDKNGEAITLNNMGIVYKRTGNIRKALKYYELALPISRKSGNKHTEAVILNNLGAIQAVLGKGSSDRGSSSNSGSSGLEYFNLALAIYQEMADKRGEATTFRNMGKAQYRLGDSHQALEYFGHAISIYRMLGDKISEALTFNNIGNVYMILADKSKALGYYEEALALCKEVGDKRGEAPTLHNIGKLQYSLGDNQKALEYFELALPLRQMAGDRSGEAATIHNMSKLYYGMGQLEKSIEYLTASVQIEVEIGHADIGLDEALLTKWQKELGHKQKGSSFWARLTGGSAR